MLDNDTITELAKYHNEQNNLSKTSLKTSELSRIIRSEPMNVNSMAEKKENKFFSQYIIGSDDQVQDGLLSNELKNNLTAKKSKETIGIIPEKKISQLSKHERYILILIDTLISTTTIGPLVVGFWRGAWILMDFHGDMFPFWMCFTFGIVIHTMFAFLKHQFCDYVNEKKKENVLNRIHCQLLRIAYSYVFGVMCVMHWRGGWIFLDKYFNLGILWINASVTTSFLGVLMTLRCIRNLLAPPFVVAIDSYSRLFLFPSLCKRVSTS